MNVEFLRAIAENNGVVPEGYSVQNLTPQILEQLGSTDMERREFCLDVLCRWIDLGPGVYYSATELRAIGVHMAYNLTIGIGEQETDSVFLRAFSVLVLDKIIDADNRQSYLDEAQVHEWLEQGLAYLKNERDGRGWVPGKGWAHALAHTADLFWVLTRSRYIREAELEKILNTIADKITEPLDHVYIYEEDERLVSAMMSALLRDVLGMTFLTGWLNRLAHPAGQPDWTKVQNRDNTEQGLVIARFHTITFLRSLYFQLLLGNNPHLSFPNKWPAVRDALRAAILDTLKEMDKWVYAK